MHAVTFHPVETNKIYAQATSGRVKQATLLVIILFLKSHDSPYNSTLKCMFLYVCVCVQYKCFCL